VLAQRECLLCGEAFQVGGKRGRPRIYCYACSPPGTQVVKVRGRLKLRRRYPPRAPLPTRWDSYDDVALRKLLEQNEADDVALVKLFEQGEADWLAWQATHL
jgi:hypothetical protein